MDNWSDYFLGRNKEIATKLLSILAPTGKLLLPQNLDSEVEGDDIAEEGSYAQAIGGGHPGYEDDVVEQIPF
jgi:hypothetical protein